RIPIPDFGTPCFWAVRPRAFARAALLRRSVPAANLLAWPAGLVLLAADVCRRSGRGRMTSKVTRVKELDERFEGLWQNIRASSIRLRAVRSCAVMAWRFRSELRDGRAIILAAEDRAALLGYAILVRRDGSDLG